MEGGFSIPSLPSLGKEGISCKYLLWLAFDQSKTMPFMKNYLKLNKGLCRNLEKCLILVLQLNRIYPIEIGKKQAMNEM